AISDAAYAAVGYRVLGARVLRIDRVERLAAEARRLARHGAFAPTPALASLAGGATEDLAAMLPSLGYRAVLGEAGVTFHGRQRRGDPQEKRRARRASRPGAKPDTADGPFAKLKELRLAR